LSRHLPEPFPADSTRTISAFVGVDYVFVNPIGNTLMQHQTLSRLTSGPMLWRHGGQCFWRAINAGRGHSLIAHQAALVGHLVRATQHLVLLVWGGRARGKICGHHDRANQRYCSFHMIILARTDIR